MNYEQIFKQAYSGKKVLLTGHTGFKGAWMLSWLHSLEAIVKGYSLSPQHGNDLYHLIAGDNLCESLIADIRNKEMLTEAIQSFKPDFIFHFAAQPLVRRSYKMPLYTFEVNVNGTIHVLEAVRELDNACTVIIITTDKVYENREINYCYNENDKLGGADPYSASKAAAEVAVSSYRHSFFHPAKYAEHGKAIATARAGNVIGGGDRSEDRIIPDLVRAVESEHPLLIRNPGAVRPWQLVLEPLSGYLLLGAKMFNEPTAYCEAWNFGPHNEDVMTVKAVAERAFEVWNKGSMETPALTDQPHEATLLMLDITKAMSRLGWKPKLNSREAIQQTIEWYKTAPLTTDVLKFTKDQIARYQLL